MLKEGDVFYFYKNSVLKKGGWVKLKLYKEKMYAVEMFPQKPNQMTRAFPIRNSNCYLDEAIDASILN
jgi:hypothetical protein